VKIQDIDVIKKSILPFNIKLGVVYGYGGFVSITIYAEICRYKNFLFQYIDKQMLIKKRKKDKDKRMIETKLITLI
jgi:hypothetical protein